MDKVRVAYNEIGLGLCNVTVKTLVPILPIPCDIVITLSIEHNNNNDLEY